MIDKKENPRVNQSKWIFGFILFIPINLIIGIGLLFSINKTIIPLFLGDIQSISIADILSLAVCLVFSSFNAYYLINTYRNLRKINGIWLLISPIIISFIEFAGCMPSYSSFM